MDAQYGKITEFKYLPLGAGQKLVAKVNVDDRTTNFLPVQCNASSFLVEHLPIAINDLVMVINPNGNNEDGHIIRNIPYEDIPLPANADKNTHIKVFKDGTNYVHNVQTKKITLNTPCDITIITEKDVNLKALNINAECKTATVKATKVNVDCSDVDLGLGGTGVQTDESICNLTGLPCNNGSSTIKATL